MPDREIRVVVSLSGLQDASSAAQGFSTDVNGVGDAAASATAQAAPLGPAIDAAAVGLGKTSTAAKEAAPALTAVETAAKTLQTALDRVAAAGDSPRGLIKSAALAQVALADYQKQATAAGVSTESMGKTVDAAGTQISAAADKVGIFKKAQADLAAQGAMTGSQLDKLRTSGTSLTGMFDSMERTGTGLTKTIGQIGVGIGIAGIAFAAAEMAGNKLAAMIDNLAKKEFALIDAEEKRKNQSVLFEAAMRALNAGLIENSDSVAGLIANYERYILSQGRATEAAKKAALGFTDAQMAALDYAAATTKAEDAGAALEGQFKDQATAEAILAKATTNYTVQQQLDNDATAKGIVIDEAAKGVSWATAAAFDAMTVAQQRLIVEKFKSNAMLQEEEPLLRKVEAAYKAIGQSVPEGVRAAINALDDLKKKNQDVAGSMADLQKIWNQLPAAMQLSIDKEKQLADSAKFVADAHDKLVPDLVKILETLRQDTKAWGESTAAHEKAIAALTAYATAHKLTIEQVMKMVTEQGDLSASLEKTDAALAAQFGNLDAAALKMGTFADRTRDAAKALGDMNAEADKNTAAIKARNAAIDDAAQKTANFAAAQTNGIAVEGQATVISITLTKATAEQTAALVDLLTAQGRYTDSLKQTLSIATGWNDYLANLLDGYNSGTTSILQYKLALASFLTMLETQFPTATGKAKAALQEMIATVQQLVNTAGAGPLPSTDNSYGGALNKQFNKP